MAINKPQVKEPYTINVGGAYWPRLLLILFWSRPIINNQEFTGFL